MELSLEPSELGKQVSQRDENPPGGNHRGRRASLTRAAETAFWALGMEFAFKVP